MKWTKIDSGLHRNPKIRLAGRNAREVFLFVLLYNAETGSDGEISSLILSPEYLSDQLQCSIDEAAEGVKQCETFHLLHVENEKVRICGWDYEWRTKTSTERVKKHREKKDEQKQQHINNETRETLRNVTLRSETHETPKKRVDIYNSVVARPTAERSPAKIKKPIPPEATGLARSLATLIAARLPNSKPARQPAKCVEAWAPDIEKIHRIDKRGWQEIEAVLAWSQDDEFWQANILSGKKLREKFDTLEAQMRKSSASRKPQPPPLERL